MTDDELKAAYKRELAALRKWIDEDRKQFELKMHRRNRVFRGVLIGFSAVLVAWCFFDGLHAPQMWAKALNAVNVTVNLWSIHSNIKSWNRYKPL